jgi:hypothetical protein
MKLIKNIAILVMVAILSLSVATTALAADDPQPDFEGCEMCHSEIAANYATSLHCGASMS